MRVLSKLDPFILALLATLAVAALLPCRGDGVRVFDDLTVALIAIMFFMQGARLSRTAVVAGLGAWKLHLVILGCTFVLFPLLGVALHALAGPVLAPDIWIGILFLCALPSTVQSSIAFTSIARGNVAAAICSATASNILGLLITPLLTGLILSKHGGVSAHAIVDIVLQLLLPFVLGQLAQPWIGGWAVRNKRLLSFSDRGSVLVVVYTAFSEAVVSGLLHQLPLGALGLIVLADAVLLGLVLLLSHYGARALGFSREDEIAIQFCGSKKTLASGVPIAKVLFAGPKVGLIVLPLMIFHQMQLLVCAWLARRYAMQEAGTGATLQGAPTSGPV